MTVNKVTTKAMRWIEGEGLIDIAFAAVIVLVGMLVARIAAAIVGRAIAGRVTAQQEMIGRRLTRYAILIIAVVSALRQVGFDMSVLLGAAGLLTVAVGFASQTSASNLISGLFLMGEKPFVLGDVITVGGTTGEVISIGLMSAQLRTFDNLLVRLPNETLLKSQVTNMTRFPIRRADIQLSVAYDTDIAAVRKLLMKIAEDNPVCMVSPEPLFLFTGFGDSAITLQFSVWAARENFVSLKNSMFLDIKKAFDAAGVEIPFPQRTVRIVDATNPSPPAP